MMKRAESRLLGLLKTASGAAFIFLLGSAAFGQNTATAKKTGQAATGPELAAVESAKPAGQVKSEPTYHGYKNVTVGMTQDAVREALGDPKEKGDKQDFFVFSDNQMVQVFYDPAGATRAVSVTYTEVDEKVPTVLTVMGKDQPPAADGSIYKRITYPKAGYWVSYNRTGGDNKIVTITIQKM